MNKLPLHHLHEAQGAHFAEFDTWTTLPDHYGNPLAEYRALTEHVGLADLSHQGTLLLTGEDRHSFLQKLISNDLDLLTDSRGIYACLLTAKGKVVSDFHLFALAEGLSPEALLIDVASNNADNTKAQLMRYRMRSKVEIVSPNWGRLLVSGPKSMGLLASYFGEPLPALSEKSLFQKKVGDTPVLCIKCAITGEEDYQLYVPAEKTEQLWNNLMEAGQAFGLSAVGQNALETRRIEAGLPRYGQDIDESVFPIEAGLASETISYTKGCYPGQEVMARIQTYGNVNKQLSGLILEGDVLPNKGDEVFHNNKKVGVITSAIKSPHLERMIAMAYLKTTVITPGTALEVESNKNRIEAAVVALPFIKGK